MAQISVSTAQLSLLASVLRGLVRFVRRLAIAGALGVAVVAALLARSGVSFPEGIAIGLLLVPSAILVFFAQGVAELVALPERLRRMPGEGEQRLRELARIAGEARTARLTGMPLLLWRLRGTLGSFRDLAGVALPLRVLAPPFLALAAIAGLLCVVLVGAGAVALLVLAVA